MPVPAKRRSASKLRRTRAHRALTKRILVLCSHCKKPVMSHRVCPYCGYYKGRQVVSVKSATVKQEKT